MLVRFLSSLIRDSRASLRAARSGKPPAPAALQGSARADDRPPPGPLQLYRDGLRGDARELAARHLASDPGNAQARLAGDLAALDFGNLTETTRLAKARQLLLAAVAADPAMADAQFLLGDVHLALGDTGAAERCYRLALELDDGLAAAHANLGAVLKDKGDPDGAALHLERALELNPSLAVAAFNLAMVRIADDQWDDVASLLRDAVRVEPRQADAWYWLGNALMRQGDAQAAREAYGTAVAQDRKFVRARWGLVMAQVPAVAMSDEEQRSGVANFARELKKLRTWIQANRAPDTHLAVGAQQPYYLAYSPQDHSAVLREYGTLCTQLMAGWGGVSSPAAPMVSRGARRKIGIVSAHICSHSVWHAFVRGWVEHLCASGVELHLLHTGQRVDAQTQWARQRVHRLHQQMGDWTAWAKAMSSERFDALVYPEVGMDATTMRLAALRLAPLQLAAWGHPVTTGLPTIDGFVSALAFEPANAQQHYTERLCALPGLGCGYQPFGTRPTAVDLAAWGIRAGDRVLVCPGAPFKYAPADDGLWVEIARRCAPCKLVFFRTDPPHLSQLLEQRLRLAFKVGGADFDASVCFVPWQSQAAFFGFLDQAHLLLDTVGFSGFNTTMQAVERGLPVVAWEGAFMRGRFASGIMRAMGLDAMVAQTPSSYADAVAQLCAQPTQLAEVREQMVQRRTSLFGDPAASAALGQLIQDFEGGASHRVP